MSSSFVDTRDWSRVSFRQSSMAGLDGGEWGFERYPSGLVGLWHSDGDGAHLRCCCYAIFRLGMTVSSEYRALGASGRWVESSENSVSFSGGSSLAY